MAAIIAAIFVYLTLDRLREMNQRLDSTEDRSAKIWLEVTREIGDVSSQKAQETVASMIQEVSKSVDQAKGKIDELLKDNPWLKDVDPSGVALKTKHLEPVIALAEAMIRRGEKARATSLVINAIEDPNMNGTPNDYHNLGVIASHDLQDGLLAAKIYESYIAKAGDLDADVLADALQEYTGAKILDKADKIAQRLRQYLDTGNPSVVPRWRCWVFLARYYQSIGREGDAIALLEKARVTLKNPESAPIVVRALAQFYLGLGDEKKATELLEESLKRFPAHAGTAAQLALFRWRNGDGKGAEDCLVSALGRGNLKPEFDIDLGQAYSMLARLKFARGDESGATEAARMALAYGTNQDYIGPIAAHLQAKSAFSRSSPQGSEVPRKGV